MLDDAVDAYDRVAEDYAESNPGAAARAGYEWPAVRATLPDLDGLDVLDAACGSGHYAAWMADRGAEVVGFDASVAMVRAARERHGDSTEFLRADLRGPLPFRDAAFDLVVCQLALEHVRDWRPTVREFARVLRDGGRVVLSCDHPFTTYHVIEHEPPEVGNADAESADYYATERFDRVWGPGEERVEVPVYRRPLSEVTAPLFEAGFVLEGLEEPTPEVKTDHLDYFTERTPRFLVVRARLP
jgi:ubiquinone/menaquinone biosynthesis C-methylase UbiE